MPPKKTAGTAKAASTAKPEILTGSGAILRSLENLGIKEVFGLPGGAIMPFYDELMSSTTIRHILV
ncbi:MAG TPA: thiamine pyrophosphate-binding protein, partial [Terrimesophilobacter sp.]|nr:thiamine pyrophosphate-binding protein [Terrimesophilobacter sp.]